MSNSADFPAGIAYCVYYQRLVRARTFLILFFRPRCRKNNGAGRIRLHVISLPRQFNVATYFVDRNILEGRAENIAIECAGERVTYQQLFERTNRVGNALRDLGVRPQERVLLLLLENAQVT